MKSFFTFLTFLLFTTLLTALGREYYIYNIANKGHYQTSVPYNNVAASQDIIEVKDVYNYLDSATRILAPPPPAISVTSLQPSCGASNGKITISASGGMPPYLYRINGGTYQASNVFPNLAAGIYNIEVKDANEGSTSINFILNSLTSLRVGLALAYTWCDPNIVYVSAHGSFGTPPYQFAVNNGPYQTSGYLPPVPFGNIVVSVKDANNCFFAVSHFIGLPALSISIATTPIVCGGNNGALTISAEGGYPPYTFSINGGPFQTSNVFSDLLTGNYTVTVKDIQGCTRTSIIMLESGIPSLTFTSTPASSCNAIDGTISSSASGGIPPYQYSLNNGGYQTSNVFSGLNAGTYVINVRDQNGCIQSSLATIINNNSTLGLSIASMNPICPLQNGSITLTATGGMAPYVYKLQNGTYQTSNTFTTLAAGLFTTEVKDAAGCIASGYATLISQPTFTADIVSVPPSCGNADGRITITTANGIGPFQYNLNNGSFQASNTFSGIPVGNYIINIKDATGCMLHLNTNLTSSSGILVDAGNDQSICKGSSLTLNASSNATTYSWSPVNGLSNPTALQPVATPLFTTMYYLLAKTGNCSSLDSILVTVNSLPVANAGADLNVCQGETVKLDGSGGVSYTWTPSTNLSSTNIRDPLVSDLGTSLNYVLSVKDTNGCISLKDTIAIQVIAKPQIFAGNDTAVQINQTMQLLAVDVNNGQFNQYTWTPSTGLTNPFIKNPVALINSDMTYHVSATTPEGCSGSDDITLHVYKEINIYVPSSFTPNGDGLNDNLRVILRGIKELNHFRIFNRYGELIFSTKNANVGWDGKFKGINQVIGTYIWEAKGTDFDNKILHKKGATTLLR